MGYKPSVTPLNTYEHLRSYVNIQLLITLLIFILNLCCSY